LVPPREPPPPLLLPPLLLPPLLLPDRGVLLLLLLLLPPPLGCPDADQELEPQVLVCAEPSVSTAAAPRGPPGKLPDELASENAPPAPASSNK